MQEQSRLVDDFDAHTASPFVEVLCARRCSSIALAFLMGAHEGLSAAKTEGALISAHCSDQTIADEAPDLFFSPKTAAGTTVLPDDRIHFSKDTVNLAPER